MESLGVAPTAMRRRVEETLDLLGLADAARPPAARRSPAASSSGSPSARCSPRTRGCWCSTSRPPRSTRPRPRRCSPRCTGWCTTSASPCCGRAPARAGRAVRRPGGPARDGGRRRRCGDPGRGDGGLARSPRRSSSSAGWPAGRRCRCRCATPAARPAPLRAAPGRRRPRRRPPPAGTGARRPVATVRAPGRAARPGGRAARRRPRRSRAGEVVALMGRNGAGKSTLLGRPRRAALRRPRGRVAARTAWRRPTCAPAELVRTGRPGAAGPGDLLYADTVGAECRGRRPRRRRRRRARRRALLDRLAAGVDPTTGTRATCPRASGWPWRWPSCWPRAPAGAARRADPRPRLRGQGPAGRRSCATWPPTGTPSCSPPTTSSWPPRSPTGWSCWPTARSSPTARPRDVVAGSPVFAPQVAKILHPLPWLTVAEVAAALEPAS